MNGRVGLEQTCNIYPTYILSLSVPLLLPAGVQHAEGGEEREGGGRWWEAKVSDGSTLQNKIKFGPFLLTKRRVLSQAAVSPTKPFKVQNKDKRFMGAFTIILTIKM